MIGGDDSPAAEGDVPLRLPFSDTTVGVRDNADPALVDVAFVIDGDIIIYELPREVWAAIQAQGYFDLAQR